MNSLPPEPTEWSEPLADAWIAVALQRISSAFALTPGCPMDGPEWNAAEAAVNAAYLARDRTGLRDALDQFENVACSAFGAWRTSRGNRPRQRVLDVLRQHGRPMTPSELAPMLNKTYSAVKLMLWRLAGEGVLTVDGGR